MKKLPLSLSDILNAQSLPLNEKQFWGLAYSLLLLWPELIYQSNKRVIANSCPDFTATDWEHEKLRLEKKVEESDQETSTQNSLDNEVIKSKLPQSPTLENVLICVNGCVFMRNQDLKDAVSFESWLNDFGYFLYQCLDFNVPVDKEVLLSEDISKFINSLVDFDGSRTTECSIINDCVEFCLQYHGVHELSVIMADLYESADIILFHLKTLEKLDMPLQTKHKIGDQTKTHVSQQKGHRDKWMKSWHFVNEEFRKGVTLNHVEPQEPVKSPPTTPHEKINDDIVNKRYSLRTVESVPENPTKPEDESPWAKLMRAIRQFAGWDNAE